MRSTLDELLEAYPEGIPYDLAGRTLDIWEPMALYERMTELGFVARWLWVPEKGQHVQHWRRKLKVKQ